MGNIHIPNSLVKVFSWDFKSRRIAAFFFHLDFNVKFPVKKFDIKEQKALSQKIGWSVKTIRKYWKSFLDSDLIYKNRDFFWLKIANELYNEIDRGCSKKSFTALTYDVKTVELKLQSITIYLCCERQEHLIENKLSRDYKVAPGSSELKSIKKTIFDNLLRQPYNRASAKVAPIVTLEKAAKLIGKKSTSTAFYLFKKLRSAKVVTIYKMPKPKRNLQYKRGSKLSIIREPPNIVFFRNW